MNVFAIVLSVLLIFSLFLYVIYVKTFYTKSHNERNYLHATFFHKYTEEEEEFVKKAIDEVVDVPYKNMSISAKDEIFLRARYYHKSTETPVDILVTGYQGLCRRDFALLFKHLHDTLGHNILLVENRAHGLSDGRYCTFGYKESEDVVLWVHEMIKITMGKAKINLIGFSMGAAAVLLASAKLDGKINKVISDASFTTGEEEMQFFVEKLYKKKGRFVYPFMALSNQVFAGFSLKKIDVVEAVRNRKTPVLFIHSKGDTMVPFCMGKKLFEEAAEPKSFIEMDESVEHGEGALKAKDIYLKGIEDFLK